jgi:hypothetical protein
MFNPVQDSYKHLVRMGPTSTRKTRNIDSLQDISYPRSWKNMHSPGTGIVFFYVLLYERAAPMAVQNSEYFGIWKRIL